MLPWQAASCASCAMSRDMSWGIPGKGNSKGSSTKLASRKLRSTRAPLDLCPVIEALGTGWQCLESPKAQQERPGAMRKHLCSWKPKVKTAAYR